MADETRRVVANFSRVVLIDRAVVVREGVGIVGQVGQEEAEDTNGKGQGLSEAAQRRLAVAR